MLGAILSMLPENRGSKLAAELIKSHPGMRLFEAASSHEGVDSLVASYFGAKVKPGSRVFLFTAIAVAAELHDRGMSVIRKSSSRFSGVRKSSFDKRHIALHRFVWGQELCETVIAQCWGRIGKERLNWIKADDRSNTNKFGVNEIFLEKFVDSDNALYERVEQVPGILDGVILRAVEAS